MNTEWRSLCSFTSNQHVDSIEYSPGGTTAICGGYQLDEVTQTRTGKLQVYSETKESFFALNQELQCAGVLDLRWIDEKHAVGALADGNISFWDFCSLATQTDSVTLSKSLLLHVDCYSLGEIHVLAVDPSNLSKPVPLRSHVGHEFEAWCVTLDTKQDSVYYSGGDDGRCCIWDLRGSCLPVSFISHEVGVCSVKNHPSQSSMISTGSYDEMLRFWDLRMISATKPQPVLSCAVGGGVWRHKWNDDGWILIAGMRGGFAVAGPFLSFNTASSFDDGPVRPVAFYRPSAELAYGIDWKCRPVIQPEELDAIVATCSFYDNQVDFSTLRISKRTQIS